MPNSDLCIAVNCNLTGIWSEPCLFSDSLLTWGLIYKGLLREQGWNVRTHLSPPKLGLHDFGKNENHDFFWVKIEITILQMILFEFENKMHLFGISAKKTHYKTHRRRDASTSSATPSTHRKPQAVARQQEYSRFRSRKKK